MNRIAWVLAWLLLLQPATGQADVVLYTVPGLKLTFVLEGRTTANPGKTLTLRHPLGTLYLGLEDVKVYKVRSPRNIAADKLLAAERKNDVEACLEAAQWALHNGQLTRFYEGLSAAWKVDPQHPTVIRLANMKRRIDAPLPPSDAQQQELHTFSRHLSGMKFAHSKHFLLLHDTSEERSRGRLTRAEQRLQLLEKVYESFLMKFSLEGVDLVVPQEHLKVVLFSRHDDYLRFVNLLGPELKSTAGFYHRVKNVSVFFDQGTHGSFQSLYDLNKALQLQKKTAIKERRPGTRELVRFADTLQLLTKLSSENLDVEVVSHEATHHMAGATGLMLGSSPMPIWAAEGLATYFESPKEAAWSGIGAVNKQRLDWYRQLARDTVHSNIKFIVSDRIFTLAATQDGKLHGYGQAWALTHFLMNQHFSKLIKWYQLVGSSQHKGQLPPDQLLATFTKVFGDDLTSLEQDWRQYMQNMKTDLQRVLDDEGR